MLKIRPWGNVCTAVHQCSRHLLTHGHTHTLRRRAPLAGDLEGALLTLSHTVLRFSPPSKRSSLVLWGLLAWSQAGPLCVVATALPVLGSPGGFPRGHSDRWTVRSESGGRRGPPSACPDLLPRRLPESSPARWSIGKDPDPSPLQGLVGLPSPCNQTPPDPGT